MVSQLRIYTINKGMMDSWLKLFEEKIRPIHNKVGIPVECTWVNADRTEFIWVRGFASAEGIPAKKPSIGARPSARLWATCPPITLPRPRSA